MLKQPSNEYDMRLRGHHLEKLAYVIRVEPLHAFYRRTEDDCTGVGHPEKADKIKFVCNKIFFNPDLRIKMVVGLDDECEPYECQPACPELKESCGDKVSKEMDLDCLKKYGLMPDHVYSSSELLNILAQQKHHPGS